MLVVINNNTIKYFLIFLFVVSFAKLKAQTTIFLEPLHDVALGYHDGHGTEDLNYPNVIQNAAYCLPGTYWGENRNRALLYFDFSSLPQNITLISARLNLFALGPFSGLQGHIGSNNASLIQRVIVPWTYNLVTWNNQPSTTTQNQCILPQSVTPTQDYLNIDVTPLINDIFNNLSSNYGLLLKLQNEMLTNGLVFCSSDHTNPNKHPYIEITYMDALNPGIIGNNQTICSYEVPQSFISIDDASGVGILQYQWQIQQACSGSWNNIIGATGTSYTPNSGLTQNSCFRRCVTNDSISSCSNVISITINQSPIACALSNSPICEGDNLQLNASGGSLYKWTGPNNFLSTLQNPLINNITMADSGLYSVVVSHTNCSDTSSINIKIFPIPYVDAGEDQSIISGDSIELNGSASQNIVWTPQASLSNPYIENPIAWPMVTTTYTISVTNSYGCSSSDIVVIYVEMLSSEVFVPNIFSPNNDGMNDILFVYGPNIREMKFFIYNRWGEKVFESNNQANGWNGKYKDKPTQAGVYVYYLNAVMYNGETVIKKGNISLVK